MSLEHRPVHVPERRDRRFGGGQLGDRPLTVGPAGVVLRRPERPGHARVRHDQHEIGGQRHGSMLERPTVQEDGRAGDAARRGELIHQAAHDSDVAVLGPLGDPGQVERVDPRTVRPGQGPGRGQLERGRRRQARRDRDRARQHTVEPAGRETGGRHLERRPGHVVDPRPGGGADVVEVELGPLAGRGQGEPDPSVRSRSAGDPDLEVDRNREHEPEVVIGVLADEIDPPRCPDDLDRWRARWRVRERRHESGRERRGIAFARDRSGGLVRAGRRQDRLLGSRAAALSRHGSGEPVRARYWPSALGQHSI